MLRGRSIDGDGRRKPLWYALRRAYADRLLTIQPYDGGLGVAAVNDGGDTWRAEFQVLRLSFAGQPRAKTAIGVEVAPGRAVTVPLPPDVARADDPAGELIVADTARGTDGAGTATGAGRALWFFAEDVDLSYPAPGFDTAVRPVPGGIAVEVTARTLLRDLALFPDRLDPEATVDEQLVTLLPGETATFTVHTARALETAALTAPPVLRCANDLVAQAPVH